MQSGRVCLFEARVNPSRRRHLSPDGDTSIGCLLERGSLEWASIAVLVRLHTHGDRATTFVAGEGNHGNDGFVAAHAPATGALLWALYLTCSNPFDSMSVEGETLRASSTSGHTLVIPIEAPVLARPLPLERPHLDV